MDVITGMSVTTMVLLGLFVLAALLVIWAARDQGDRPAAVPARTPRHSTRTGEGATRRLEWHEPPTEIIAGQATRGRCHCLHLAHIGRCRVRECGCVSPEGYTDPRAQ
jgi:hypothetical protein